MTASAMRNAVRGNKGILLYGLVGQWVLSNYTKWMIVLDL